MTNIKHHFVGGLYAKETSIPAGVKLPQHAHKFDHLSALMSGTAMVIVDGVATTYNAPALLTIKAGVVHTVLSISDVMWICLHATNETDAEKIDAELIA